MIAFSVSLISVNTVVSSNSSYNVALPVVNWSSSSLSVLPIKTVVDNFGVVIVTGNFSVVVVDDVVDATVVVVVCGFFVDGFVVAVSVGLGFAVMGFLVIGALLDDTIIGFRVGKRVVSVNTADDVIVGLNDELNVVCAVLGDWVTLGIRIHSGGCSVFTETKTHQIPSFFFFFLNFCFN